MRASGHRFPPIARADRDQWPIGTRGWKWWGIGGWRHCTVVGYTRCFIRCTMDKYPFKCTTIPSLLLRHHPHETP